MCSSYNDYYYCEMNNCRFCLLHHIYCSHSSSLLVCLFVLQSINEDRAYELNTYYTCISSTFLYMHGSADLLDVSFVDNYNHDYQ